MYMTRTALQIINAALYELGTLPLEAISDTSDNAAVMKERYVTLRELLKRDYLWNFAKAISILSSPTTSSLTDDWAYSFSMPSDVGRLMSIMHGGEPVPYELADRVIHTNAPTITIRYVAGSTDDAASDAENYPIDFAEVLSLELAAAACMKITQNIGLQDRLYSRAKERLALARHNGAVERYPQTMGSDLWVSSRYGIEERDIESKNLSS